MNQSENKAQVTIRLANPRTEQNDSVNAPMLAINRKLGYVRQEGLGHYGLVNELS